MWSPPDNPVPSQVFESARKDVSNGSYEQALDKLRWLGDRFRHGASARNRLLYSPTLAEWKRLASNYPPAMDELIKTRDETEAAHRTAPSNLELFSDVALLNKQLGDEARTADLFRNIGDHDPKLAKRFYSSAEPSLLAAGRYTACGPFLDPAGRMKGYADFYGLLNGFEMSRPDFPKTARSHYIQCVATLVTLLVLNRRDEEAERVCTQAVTFLNLEECCPMLKAAMQGQLPYS
jgi:hypothetical protein